jgi:predicted dehydrogenase
MQKLRWGVLGVAGIAMKKVIPAMQRGSLTEVVAIASRDRGKADDAAKMLGIPRAYGSYDALLADTDVEAVYIPLPNHLHLEWATHAAEAGKHVLCEKPIALTAAEARTLVEVRDRTGVTIQEAFMVRTHPQWLQAQAIVRSGRVGELRAMAGFFSYYNADPRNIRNIADYGGGALMDIGCYLVTTARMMFEREPDRVMAAVERDPVMRTDRLTSIVLDFGSGHAIGTCATQLVPHQRMNILGTRGRIELEIPFNAPPDRPSVMTVDDGSDLFGAGIERITFDVIDQYTVQGDRFSRTVREGIEPAVPLEDAVANMTAIDALFRSAETGCWERLAGVTDRSTAS